METSDRRIQTICLVIPTIIVCGVVLHLLTSASAYENRLKELVGGTLRVLRLPHFGIDPDLLTRLLLYLPIQSLIEDLEQPKAAGYAPFSGAASWVRNPFSPATEEIEKNGRNHNRGFRIGRRSPERA